jgi:hypothetical protein
MQAFFSGRRWAIPRIDGTHAYSPSGLAILSSDSCISEQGSSESGVSAEDTLTRETTAAGRNHSPRRYLIHIESPIIRSEKVKPLEPLL